MKRLAYLVLAAAVLVGVGSCSLLVQLFGCGEARVLAFVIEGMVGTAVIDPSARTVTVEVEPMDLSSAEPTVTVSENAELTQRPPLVDGQPVTYVLTDENGDTVLWYVTVTVQYGVSFTLGGTKVVLTSGLMSSTDPDLSDRLGDGLPSTEYHPSSGGDDCSFIFAYSDPFDFPAGPVPSTCLQISFLWRGATPGPGSFPDAALWLDNPSDPANSYEYSALDLDVAEYGPVGSDVHGMFSGTLIKQSDGSEHALAGGYFKVLRIADDAI